MTSECPSCHKSIEHEDFLFEVKCEHCGCRFNPFMGATADLAGLENVNVGPNSMAPETASDSAAVDAANYTESNDSFQEIRDFAENLGTGQESPVVPPPSPAPGQSGAPGKAKAPVHFTPVAAGEEFPMSAGDGMDGFVVEAYLPPLSAICELDLAGDNPLQSGFEKLATGARALGANGIVAMRWSLTSDSTKVLLSGTPVRCRRT